MNGRFNESYAPGGRDWIAPEKLIRALLLQVFYSVRSERQGLLSKEHFSVAGTLLQAWASQKSFRPKDGSNEQRPGGGGRNAQADWKGKPRSNDTHARTTDPDARNYRKSHHAAIVCYQGHALMENRSGLVVSAVLTHADGFGERRAAVARMDALPATPSRRSVGADKAHFVAAHRERKFAPHIACNDTRHGGSAIDGRTTRHPPYRLRQIVRGTLRLRQDHRPNPADRFRGLARVDLQFKLTLTASNLMRLARMPMAVPAGAAR